MDAAQPEHRLLFATRLRDLRRECGQPPYRTLSRLAHCGSGSLSEAAGGRRFPSWETTRGYVTGCLRHAGRETEIDQVLPRWRRTWEETEVRERAFRMDPAPTTPVNGTPAPNGTPPSPGTGTPAHNGAAAHDALSSRDGAPADDHSSLLPAMPVRQVRTYPDAEPAWAPSQPGPGRAGSARRRVVLRAAAAVVIVLTLLGTMAAARSAPPAPVPMAGLYNILVAPFDSLPGLEQTIVRDLRDWAGTDSAIETRGPAAINPVTGDERYREAALTRLAETHQADVVLTGRRHAVGDRWTVVIELLLTARVFGETPEFVGRHEFRLSEPADLVRGNVELSRRLADDALGYVKAVVAFVRGLGNYALDDYRGAEREFRTADHELTSVSSARAEVVQLMLGNAIGRERRYGEAAATFRRALEQEPGYARATVGLAEALRAEAGCDRGGDGTRPLREALGFYQAALTGRHDVLLEMKAHLGLGLTYQCLSIAHAGDHWQEATAEFAAVLHAHEAARLTEEAGRQSLRLAAEARAGQALVIFLTRSGPPDAQQRKLARAAEAYEEALGLLGRIGVTRPTIRQRELVFLKNLREVYRAQNASAKVAAIDERIRKTWGVA